VSLKDVGHGLRAHLDSQVIQGSCDPLVAPGPIFAGHLEDEVLDLNLRPRTSGTASLFGAVELAGDELPIPAQKSLGRDEGRNFTESSTTETHSDLREGLALGVRESEASPEMPPEDPVLREEVLVPKQKFLVDRAGDVGESPFPIQASSSN